MSEAVHVDNDGIASFKTFHTEAQILDGLRMLRDENLRDEITLDFLRITWTESISQEMIKTFQFHQNLGHHWKLVCFSFPTETTNAHIHSVIESQVTTEFFRTFLFLASHPPLTSPMNKQMATSIAFPLRRGCTVFIDDIIIGQESMSILSEGLVTLAHRERSSGVSDAPQCLYLRSGRFLHDEDSRETRSAVQCLADGLERNKTLKTFCCNMGLDDAAAAEIFRSLIGHPSLTSLDMRNVEFGELATTAFRRVLAPLSCKVVFYTFPNHRPVTEGGPEFDMGPFLAQLRAIVRERLYLNRCIDVRLRREKVPLSYWAEALARVNNPNPILPIADTAPRQAYVTYEMLHGPVFAGRGRFDP